MKYTVDEWIRLIGYCAGIAAGIAFAIIGAFTANPVLTTAGLALLGVGGTAAVKTNKTKAKPIEFRAEELPTAQPVADDETAADVDEVDMENIEDDEPAGVTSTPKHA